MTAERPADRAADVLAVEAEQPYDPDDQRTYSEQRADNALAVLLLVYRLIELRAAVLHEDQS